MLKRILVLGLFAMILTTGCKKDYTCQCTTENPLGGDDYVIPYQIENTRKKKAEEACQSKENEENASPSDPKTTCVLE